MLVVENADLMLSTNFSLKDLLSSSSLPARAALTVITRPMLKAIAASRSAVDKFCMIGFCTNRPVALVSRIALFLFKVVGSRRPRRSFTPVIGAQLNTLVSAGIRALLRRVPPGRSHTAGPLPRQQSPR